MAALGQAEADARVSTAVPPAEALKHMFMYKALRMNGKKYSSSIGYFTCGTLACVQTWETQHNVKNKKVLSPFLFVRANLEVDWTRPEGFSGL